MKVGVFSGTFDPVHSGHLAVAHAALIMHALDLVLFTVEQTPWRDKEPTAAYEERVAMVRVAIAGQNGCELFEADQSQHNLQTLLDVARRYKPTELFIILGSDTAQLFAEWEEHQQILRLAKIITVSREAQPAQIMIDHPARSQQIRAQLASGEQPLHLPEDVYRYIQTNRLYGTMTTK